MCSMGPINKMNSMIELYPKGFAGFRRFKELMNVEIDIEDAPMPFQLQRLKDVWNIKMSGLDMKTIRKYWNIST